MADTNLAWFPLVLRERPPGRSLETRIAELTRLAEPDGNAPNRTRITQAAEVFNKAALIASDCGLPDLARALCDQQFEMFTQARPWTAWLPRLAIQPLLNVARQLIRDGHGDDAYVMLNALHGAARARRNLTMGGHAIDFRALTNSSQDHKALCTELWTALLADGTRALAQAGRWTQAAEQAQAHHGIGARLLDGRQISIIARLTEGRTAEAVMLVEQSHATELWENTVQCILRVLCQGPDGNASQEIDRMLAGVHDMTQLANATTTAACTRVGIVALDLAAAYDHPKVRTLHADLLSLTEQDAYAARDALGSAAFSSRLAAEQGYRLRELVRDSGLHSGSIPARLYDQLTAAVERAATTLLAGLARGVNGDAIGNLPAWVRVLISGSQRDAACCGSLLGGDAMVTVTADEDEVCQLRSAMVDSLSPATPISDQVRQAMGAVPRERFLPGVPLQDAYSDGIVTTHRDAHGTVLSCTPSRAPSRACSSSSTCAPATASWRSAQAPASTQPYSPTWPDPTARSPPLTSCPRRPTGHATWPPPATPPSKSSPATAPAGTNQAPPTTGSSPRPPPGTSTRTGPLRPPPTRGWWSRYGSPASPRGHLHPRPAAWRAAVDQRVLPPVRVHQAARPRPPRRARRAHRVRRPVRAPRRRRRPRRAGRPGPRHRQAGTTSLDGLHPGDPALPDLEIWLAGLGGPTRLINRYPGHGLARATGQGGSLAVLNDTGDTLAYLTFRAGSGEAAPLELGVCVYGSRSDQLADRVVGRIEAWADEQANTRRTIEIYLIGATAPPGESLLTVTKEHTMIAVRTTR